MSGETKECVQCGDAFSKHPKHTRARWEASKYCGFKCSGLSRRTHWLSAGQRIAEYAAWIGMIMRCENRNDKDYPGYGGRGIRVCERWRNSFENFLSDMGFRPSPDHSIDRKDNDLGYSPENCRWATRKQQQGNRRNSHIVEIDGEHVCLSEAARRLGLPVTTITSRLSQGWSLTDALHSALYAKGAHVRRTKSI